jgi:hypothetical protein
MNAERAPHMVDATGVDDFSRRGLAFAAVHVGHDTARLVPNLHSRVELLREGALALPVTVDDGTQANAWVCSPRTTYADYAMEEAARAAPWLAWPCAGLGAGLRAWLGHAGVDRVAMLNNWLLSTNLPPALADVPLAAVFDQAHARWPGHALWWRSLNEVDHADWIAALERHGFRRIASRQVYLYDDWPTLAKRHYNLRHDLRLLERDDLRGVDDAVIDEADYARIAALYEQLYVGKYSRHNPRYSAAFLRAWHRAGLLEFAALRAADGGLRSVVGLFRQGGALTAPIVGYDTTRPRTEALYRWLAARACGTAMDRGLRLNFSAGAAHFKRLRGGRPALEYSLVSTRDVPRRTRRAVATLGVLSRRVAAPLLRRYEL